MLVSLGKRIESQIIDNLIEAHSRFDPSRSVIAYFLLTRFILRLAKQREDAMVELIPEEE